MPFHNQLLEVSKRELGALERKFASQMEAPQNLNNFNIDEMRSVKTLSRIQRARSNTVCTRGPQHQLDRSRGIQHDHRESRSSRNTSVGDNFPV
jgi:hypothetical protein